MSRTSLRWLGQGGDAMASDGLSRRRRATRASIIAALLLSCLPVTARAADSPISIAPTTLDAALTALARQSGADIISTEPGLRQIHVKGIAGRMPVRRALDRLLAGTGYRAIAIDANSYRIVRAALQPQAAARPRPAPASDEAVTPDIIVTASKQAVTLLRFPGSLVVASKATPRSAGTRPPNMDDIARETPVLQNTEFGAGRNKIFIRGIADSSFNGSTQSTASIYFGDVQLGYSGPEPSLNLYDISRVEVLEGPQGTLYGAGAIGGIIRLTPNPVNLAKSEGSVAAGITATNGGGIGGDLSGMLNVPLLNDKVGVRMVAYRVRDGGYIDDHLRRLSNINSTDTVGGRIALGIDAGDGWSVDSGGLIQRIDAADAQYAEVRYGPLSRGSILAEPFHNQVVLGRAVISKKWDNELELVSATGVVSTHASDTYDASRSINVFGPTVYENNDANFLLTHETRLVRTIAGGISWVAGIALLYDRDAQTRSFGTPGDPAEIIGATNITKSVSAFAEGTFPLSPSFSITIGGRATTARTDGEPSTRPRAEDFVRGRSTKRLDPTAAISWLIAPRLAAFARFQSGYRTGGIAVARGVGRIADFQSDSIRVGEVGLRMERRGTTGLAMSTSLSFAHWSDIQADLFNRRGQPYTANIGDANIVAVEGTGDWVPIPGLHANFAFLYTHNRLDGPLAQLSILANRRLPETPPFAGNVGLSYQWAGRGENSFSLGGSVRYVGRSVLGPGDFLDISQGRYAVLNINGSWKWRNIDASLAIDNLTNQSDNRFALGNPIILGTRDQTTPLRPMNVRAGVAISW
ncbi:MAG: TonB-dependent receptor [Sphingomonas bacterium]